MAVVINGTTGITTPTESVATTIGVGGATPSASGSGVTFPATQSASTNANTLDDYEEGTWTPTANGVTFTSVAGWYTKIGNLVFIAWRVTFPSTANTNSATIDGLPFNVKSDQYSGSNAITDFGSANLLPMIDQGNTKIFLRDYSNNTYTNANFSTRFHYGCGVYQVN